MRKLPHYEKMASGEYSLILEGGVDWHSFPSFAEKWVQRLSLLVIEKVDSVDVRLWVCEKNGKRFWLAHDDWFPSISLEPQNGEAGEEIFQIGKSLGIETGDQVRLNSAPPA